MTKLQDPVTKTMKGLALYADIIDMQMHEPRWPMLMASLLSDQLEEDLRFAFHMAVLKRVALNEEDLQHASVTELYVHTKATAREKCEAIIHRVESQNAMARRQQVLAELTKHNQPSEQGTVAQIAQRLGISKSEVRRRRADGLL